jgi:hypothetical protein
VASTVPTDAVLEAHVPPTGVEDKADVLPAHATSVPDIDAGSGLTVTTEVVIQPVADIEYVTVEVPAETAVIAPVAAPTVATDVEPLIQTPPEVELDRVPDSPTQ